MSLSFEYGINIGNRFGQFIDHEEDPDEFIAQQTQADEKAKKGEKTKSASATTKKSTSTSSTTATGATAKSNKENVTGRSTGTEPRKPSNAPSNDNQQQGAGRAESGRGGGRGGSYPRRGGSAGPDRGGRGGGNPRYNRAEGQQTGGFEQSADTWTGESGNDNQTFPGSRGRGGGGGGRGRGNYEGGRGFGRGRGEGRGEGGRGRGRGRGFNSNRQFNDAPQGQEQESSTWEQSAASNFESRGPSGAADAEIPFSAQGQNFDSEQSGGRGGRGQYRSRTFRSNRNQGERSYHQERADGEQQGGQDDYRQNRRAHDRQPRNFISSVKPIEKKDGQGAHNWGDQTEVPEEEPVVVDEAAEGGAAPAAGAAPKDWAQRVDEEEQRLITFDEYKRQIEEKKKTAVEKLPQFNRRTAGEGEDPKAWKAPEQVYRKKNEDDATDDDDEENVESQGEEAASEDEGDEQLVGKKKIINIPLRFKPIETPRGSLGGRGGRRGAPRPSADRPAPREDQGQATQQQQATAPATQPAGDEERPQSGYQRGGRGAGGPSSRGGAGRGEYRRSYGNAARGSRGAHQYSSGGKSGDATSKFDFGNTDEFPTLAKQG